MSKENKAPDQKVISIPDHNFSDIGLNLQALYIEMQNLPSSEFSKKQLSILWNQWNGRFFQRARLGRKYTEKTAAEGLKIDPALLRRIEEGAQISEAQLEKFLKFYNAFNYHAEFLFRFKVLTRPEEAQWIQDKGYDIFKSTGILLSDLDYKTAIRLGKKSAAILNFPNP